MVDTSNYRGSASSKRNGPNGGVIITSPLRRARATPVALGDPTRRKRPSGGITGSACTKCRRWSRCVRGSLPGFRVCVSCPSRRRMTCAVGPLPNTFIVASMTFHSSLSRPGRQCDGGRAECRTDRFEDQARPGQWEWELFTGPWSRKASTPSPMPRMAVVSVDVRNWSKKSTSGFLPEQFILLPCRRRSP